MNTARILKKIKEFNSDCIAKPADINKLISVLKKQIKEDQKKKTKSAFKTVAEKRLNKKTLAKMNQILIDFNDHLKHFTDPESLAREAAHLCM